MIPPKAPAKFARPAWLAVTVGLALGYLAIAFSPPAQGAAVRQYLASYSFTFVLYFFCIALLRRALRLRSGQALPGALLLWLGALAFRLIILTTAPGLSDDVYRYVWDGRVLAAGVNPYAQRVDSPLLDALDIPARENVNNAWMASPYLPTAQLQFWGLAVVASQSVLAHQIVAVAFDLATGWLLSKILRAFGKSSKWALVYLWNPLIVMEFAHGAHIDSSMIFLSVAALWALVRVGRIWQLASGALLALATLTKGLPALLLAVMWPLWGWLAWLAFAAVGGGLSLPFLAGAGSGLTGARTGVGLFGALRIYGYQWNYNGGLYHWLELWTTGLRFEGALPPETPGVAQAKLIAVLALFAAIAAVTIISHPGVRRQRRSRRIGLPNLRLGWALLFIYFLLTPTVHPWYVTFLVPGAVFFLLDEKDAGSNWGWRLFGYAVLLWSWSVALSYSTYIDPANLRETDAVRLAEYAPVYALLVGALAAGLLHSRTKIK